VKESCSSIVFELIGRTTEKKRHAKSNKLALPSCVWTKGFVVSLLYIVLFHPSKTFTKQQQLQFPTLSKWRGKLNLCFFCDLRCMREIEQYGYTKSHINDYYRENVRIINNVFQNNGIQLTVSAPHIVKFNTMYDDLLFRGTQPNTGRYNLVKLVRYFFKKRIPTKSWLKVGCNVIFWTPASDDLVFRNTSVEGFSHRYQMCMDEPYGMIRLTPSPALAFLREILNLMGVYGDDEVPKTTYHYSLFEPLNAPVLRYCDGNRGSSCSAYPGSKDCVMKNTNKNTLSNTGINSWIMSNCTKAYLEFWLQVANRYPTIYSHQCLK